MSSLSKVDYKKFFWPIVIAAIIWLCSGFRPDGISLEAWRILAIFVGTIIGCIVQPIPIAGVAIVGITIAVLLKVVPMEEAVTGFGSNTVWLIAMAYFLSRGFVKTGLGRRVALIFIRMFGKKTLGLAYSLIGVDVLTGSATPSSTARAGGIVYPIIESLAEVYGSSPQDGTERKIGSFLIFSEFHGNNITSGLFLTAMAPNLLAATFAKSMGINISWITWFTAAIVPGILSLIIIPYVIYKMYPPEIKETPNAKEWANDELAKMGKITVAEKIMMAVFVLALALWMLSSFIGLDATFVAFLAVSLLLVTGVLNVSDILNETGAWNTLIWFSILIFMANELTKLGLIGWLSKTMGSMLSGYNWMIVLFVIVIFYFYTHYLFASGTAQTSAMYSALLAVAISAGAPHLLSALLLGFTAAIFGSTTHYSNGPASILFGTGYVKQSDWWRMNFILGLIYIVIWIGIGTLWMKLIGIW
ncbi:anion permease [Lentilactobacillus laojiaonis]|uniref:anion permease n=1 Tax=Lentilactobacillus laojiaonis TaxID=2883998 RepID=UPI001D09C591|nr:anion permease [Lentilactobacillus laojiaonis]UDM32079.1 anion permease [Lentilactobacillus laojiaonis]